jgi:hypothetical protein
MASGYVKAECGVTPFTPTRWTRLCDVLIMAAGYSLTVYKATLIWSMFQ